MKIHNLAFIVHSGTNKSLTLASIMFNQYGVSTGHKVIQCNTWSEGFHQARSSGVQYGLFVSAGTVFRDVAGFLQDLNNYPHRGLVGHITDPLDGTGFYLDQQCFLLELEHFEIEDFELGAYITFDAVRSDQNIHHDYTPIWLRPDSASTPVFRTAKNFGEQLIARQLMRDELVVNFLPHMRDKKIYLYNNQLIEEFLVDQDEYQNIAETQLWVFNNEPFRVYNHNRTLAAPASGLYWMLHLIATNIDTVHLVDISYPQIQLAQALWYDWDGVNYGEFVHHFMQTHSVKHYNISLAHNSREEKIKLMKASYFIDTVNQMFDAHCREHGIENFSELWNRIKHKHVDFAHGDMLPYVHDNITQTFDLWLSNIFNYKYTLLQHDFDWLEHLNNKIAGSNIHLK